MAFRQLGLFNYPADQLNTILRRLSLRLHPDKGGDIKDFRILQELRTYVNECITSNTFHNISEYEFLNKNKAINMAELNQFVQKIHNLVTSHTHQQVVKCRITVIIDMITSRTKYLSQSKHLTSRILAFILSEFPDMDFDLDSVSFKIVHCKGTLRTHIKNLKRTDNSHFIIVDQGDYSSQLRPHLSSISDQFVAILTNNRHLSDLISELSFRNKSCIVLCDKVCRDCLNYEQTYDAKRVI